MQAWYYLCARNELSRGAAGRALERCEVPVPPSEELDIVFVVRFWQERREIEGAAPEWRGVIEHLPSRTRRYLKDPVEIASFIGLFLDAGPGLAGVDPDPTRRK
jgi:hypothetical protein